MVLIRPKSIMASERNLMYHLFGDFKYSLSTLSVEIVRRGASERRFRRRTCVGRSGMKGRSTDANATVSMFPSSRLTC